MSAIPPQFEVPGGVPILGQPQPRVQPTIHKTEFHMCSAGFFAVLDDDDICTGYQLQIIDPLERHQYTFDFGQEVFDDWMRDFLQFPKVGEKPKAVDESN